MSERRKGRRRGGPRNVRWLPSGDVDDEFGLWTDYCGGRMFIVGRTEGGAPYGSVEWPAGSYVDHDGVRRDWGEGAEPF